MPSLVSLASGERSSARRARTWALSTDGMGEKLRLWEPWADCAVVGLHIAGMVWHRLVKRDSVQALMLPGIR